MIPCTNCTYHTVSFHRKSLGGDNGSIIIVFTMLENLLCMATQFFWLQKSSSSKQRTRWCLILGWCHPNNCLLAIRGMQYPPSLAFIPLPWVKCGIEARYAAAIANKLQLLLPLFCCWIKPTDSHSNNPLCASTFGRFSAQYLAPVY